MSEPISEIDINAPQEYINLLTPIKVEQIYSADQLLNYGTSQIKALDGSTTAPMQTIIQNSFAYLNNQFNPRAAEVHDRLQQTAREIREAYLNSLPWTLELQQAYASELLAGFVSVAFVERQRVSPTHNAIGFSANG